MEFIQTYEVIAIFINPHAKPGHPRVDRPAANPRP